MNAPQLPPELRAHDVSLPVIDISGDPEAAARDMDAYAREYGCWYLSGHGISERCISDTYAAASRFFALPETDKRAVSAHRGGDVRGYTGLFEESNDPTANGDRKECFDVRLDLPENDADWQMGNAFYAPNPWPDLPGFRCSVMEYFDANLELARRILSLLAGLLGTPPRFIERNFSKPLTNLRLLHYPSESGPIDPSRIGTGAHTDYECITLLHQSSEGGLQVLLPDNRWAAAPPRPGCLVVTIGDSLRRWTNAHYRAAPHRVVNTSGRERYSLPFFLGANYNAVIAPLSSCCDDGERIRYDAITQGEWLTDRYGGTFTAKGWGEAE